MALELDSRYPGRFNPGDSDYPQGSFKNRTAPGALDGSYLEKDWANDKEGFFQRLMLVAGISPNGSVDTALASQYYDALLQVISDQASIPGGLLGSGIRGSYSNLSAVAVGANATVTFTAEAICAKNASNEQVVLNNVSESCDLLTSGVGGIDTGSIAASSWYAVYVIYNPTTDDVAAVASLSFSAPTLPAGYTHYAFIEAVRTNGGATLLSPFTMDNGEVFYTPTAGTSIPSDFPVALNIGTATSLTAVSLASLIPPSAKVGKLGFNCSGPSTATASLRTGSAATSGLLALTIGTGAVSPRQQVECPRPYALGVYYSVAGSGQATILVEGWRS